MDAPSTHHRSTRGSVYPLTRFPRRSQHLVRSHAAGYDRLARRSRGPQSRSQTQTLRGVVPERRGAWQVDDAALSREMLPGRTTGPNEPARPVRRCDPRSRAGEHVFTACGAGARRAIPRKRGPKPDRLGKRLRTYQRWRRFPLHATIVSDNCRRTRPSQRRYGQ